MFDPRKMAMPADEPTAPEKKPGKGVAIVIEAGTDKPDAAGDVCPTCGRPMHDDEAAEAVPDNEPDEGESPMAQDLKRRLR